MAGLRENVKEVFAISGFVALIPVFDTLEAAKEAMKKRRANDRSMLIEQMPARMENLHELLAFITDEAKKKGFTRGPAAD